MITKNTPRGMLLNDEVLNLSMKLIKDMLGLDSAPNAEYSDEMVVYHILNACTSPIQKRTKNFMTHENVK